MPKETKILDRRSMEELRESPIGDKVYEAIAVLDNELAELKSKVAELHKRTYGSTRFGGDTK